MSGYCRLNDETVVFDEGLRSTNLVERAAKVISAKFSRSDPTGNAGGPIPALENLCRLAFEKGRRPG
jgi:hypothetical protein